MDGQPPAVHIVRFLTQQIEKLRVDHRNQEIERAVRVAHDKEQRRPLISKGVQLQLIVGRDFPQLLNVKGRKPRTAGNQYALGCLARNKMSRTFSSNSQISYILRTSSRSIRLILSAMVSLVSSLKWTRTT